VLFRSIQLKPSRREPKVGLSDHPLRSTLAMTEPHEVLQSQIVLGVCCFLDPCDLGSVEAAGWDRQCVVASWLSLRTAVEEDFAGKPWWKDRPTLPEDSKEALRELKLLSRSFASIPVGWAACIRRLSATDIEIHPRPPTLSRPQSTSSTRGGAHHGGTEDYVGLDQGDQQRPEAGRRLVPPRLAGVPLSLGSLRGEAMSIGVRLTSQRVSRVGEAFLLGAEFVAVEGGMGVFTGVYFAPVSGRVFVKYPGAPEGLVSQPMPSLEVSSAAGTELEEVEAFMLVSASGCVSFGRRCGADGPVEWSGELPHEFFSAYVEERYASLTFQIDQLDEVAQVSVAWFGSELPADLARTMPPSTFEAIWGTHEW